MVVSESGVLEILRSVFPLSGLTAVEQSALERVDMPLVIEWTRFLFPELKNNPQAASLLRNLLNRIASSEHSMNDWIKCFVVIYRWLHTEQLSAHFSDIVEYASCALPGSSEEGGPGLTWYLENYGMERSWRIPVRHALKQD